MVDYPNDFGCASYSDTNETKYQCEDGSDNDGDTKTDYSILYGDSECISLTDNDESPRDFCSDSDWGQITRTLGSVSGEDASVGFNSTDFALTLLILREYYCGSKAEGYNPLSIDVNCVVNGTTSCSAGACV